MLKSPDQVLIDLSQSVYDYLWDRYGVPIGVYKLVWFVGTWILPMVVGVFTLSVWMLSMAVVMFNCGIAYYAWTERWRRECQWQADGKHDYINIAALLIREHKVNVAMRYVVLFVSIIAGAANFAAWRPVIGGLLVCGGVALYQMVLFSRDREPRDAKTAHQGSF